MVVLQTYSMIGFNKSYCAYVCLVQWADDAATLAPIDLFPCSRASMQVDYLEENCTRLEANIVEKRKNLEAVTNVMQIKIMQQQQQQQQGGPAKS